MNILNTYDLQDLKKKFILDHERYIKEKKEHLEKQRTMIPDEEIPEWMKDEFSLPLAIATICHEILVLKEGKKT